MRSTARNYFACLPLSASTGGVAIFTKWKVKGTLNALIQALCDPKARKGGPKGDRKKAPHAQQRLALAQRPLRLPVSISCHLHSYNRFRLPFAAIVDRHLGTLLGGSLASHAA
jgi:hypothetical protein